LVERAAARFEELCRRSMLLMPIVVLLSLGLRVIPEPGLREDEVQCEEARAHLEECCPVYEGNVACQFVDPGACEAATYPDLDTDESRLMQSLSCNDVVARGLCTLEFDHSAPPDAEDSY
jgi:hypothetical protein